MITHSRKRLVVFHMLNDYSGSPHVLSEVLKGLVGLGYKIDLYTSRNRDGFLSDLPGVKIRWVNYRYNRNKFITSVWFAVVQIRYFFISLKYSSDNSVFYINTIIPFGAAIGSRLKGVKVIYHVHERPLKMNPVFVLGTRVLEKCASRIIFVSDYLRIAFNFPEKKSDTVYNSLSAEFIELAKKSEPVFREKAVLLMISSLKKYKGIDQFVRLASMSTDKEFVLVLNAEESEIERYFCSTHLPGNLKIFSGSRDVHKYYSEANILLNLTNVNTCHESFGMTILEGFAYGLPAIGPSAGGPAELIIDGLNGFLVDTNDLQAIVASVNRLLENRDRYMKFSENARETSSKYDFFEMINKISGIINDVSNKQ